MSSNDHVLHISQVLIDEYRALGRPLPVTEAELDREFESRREDLDKVKAVIDRQHANVPDQPVSALCLSGGGIRSATFCLGALQRLAKEGLLTKFDYLSTVSGGGYIGSWLKAWAWQERSRGGMQRVQEQLANRLEEPAPVRHLRYYSNYLAPKIGALSADTWALISTYLRNLMLNWLVLVPLLMLPLLLPRFELVLLRDFGELGFSKTALFAVSALLLLYGLIRARLSLPSGGGPRMALGQERFLLHALLPVGLGALGLTVWWYQILLLEPEARSAMNMWVWANGFGLAPWPVPQPDGFSYLSLLGISALLLLVAMLVEIVLLWMSRHGKGEHAAKRNGYLGKLIASIATAFVAAGLLWVWSSLFTFDPRDQQAVFLYAALGFPALLAALSLSEVFYIGVASRATTDEDREWWARAGAWDLIVMVSWVALGAVVIYGPRLIEEWSAIGQAALGAAGLTAGGLAAKLGQSVATAASAGGARSGDGTAKTERSGGWVTLLAFLALPVFFVVALIFLAYAADWLLMVARCAWDGYCAFPLSHNQVFGESTLAQLLLVSAALLASGLLMGMVVHVNKFSLHAMYRNRLIRAYLGASRGGARKPNPFSGFDESDNINLKDMRDDGAVAKPLHVVNIALNLVRGEQLAWQERKAESFTASALHCGAYDVGYRRTEHYGGRNGMTLGTAVAISGAAFSPNAGYHSSPLITFVMSLFNVRLGWWLGNPRHSTARRPGPNHAALPLLNETFGLTDDRNKWVYLSDGGHFDNLGLYEMVVRRCRRIVVLDASADENYVFDDLGGAIRKIRADLGVAIDFEKKVRIGRGADTSYYALFRIRYAGGTGAAEDPRDGQLLYVKPAVNGGEPMDIYHYRATNASFPHQSTADQFFSESQFESYRALGFHEMDAIIGKGKPQTVAELIDIADEGAGPGDAAGTAEAATRRVA